MQEDPRIGWRHWYHITLGTYGHWLPCDDRSWRERHHRKHVAGSHIHPPAPSRYAAGLHAYSKKLMKRPPVAFDPKYFATIGAHLLASLAIQESPVLCISVGTEHCHLLVQCLADDPRSCAGKMKNHVYHRLFTAQRTPWEKRSHEEPIEDYAHGKRVFTYIMEHASEGAWVWSHKESRPIVDS